MTIKNLDKLMKRINQLQKITSTREFEKIVSRNNKAIVQANAKLLAPVNNGELRNSINADTEIKGSSIIASTYTNKQQAMYVEFGTGPKGQANHEGISPNVNVSYSQHGWGIPADKVDSSDALRYKWPKRVYQGKEYYMTSGQAAQPFLYPALKNNETKVINRIAKDLKKKIKEGVSK